MDSITIPREEMIEEHKRLVKILKKGKRKMLNREALLQERELKHYEKHYDYCPRCRKRREHFKYSGVKTCKTCCYTERDDNIAKKILNY